MSSTLARPRERAEDVASTGQLRAVIARALGHSRRVVDIERAPCVYGSSWWLEDITVHLEDGSRLALVFKAPGREAEGSGARRIKPAFVTDPNREAWVYGTLLPHVQTGPPKLWAAVNDAATGRHWLFLERVDGVPLAQIGDRSTWCRVAHWLGRFHATAPAPPTGSPLLRHDREYHRGWMARALAAAGAESRSSVAHVAREKRARLRAIATVHERAVQEVVGEGETLIHGEFYPSNVLVDQRGTSCSIHPLDWEMAGAGPPLLDLAALLSGRWGRDDRETMQQAYCEGATEARACFATPDAFRRGLTACGLLLAVQWLGWARGWDPPPDHQNDWLEEAERCAEELRS